ncbi:hypothetical protein K443DRAFT_12461 [Laccaria amethystina LaAM-08-1]|uniref:Unplaced genomic scaffold K443scaffold_278, whole genome shotgun sequence n=1 Tax=Laccaria amethystina LaAM-08-1 TaxID=1095629 RepID=A0A0C9X8U3_9AGAR|nr:hypothetical protein K443DRAFT_12461 [Laccaria amethystina LaAM-08-1]
MPLGFAKLSVWAYQLFFKFEKPWKTFVIFANFSSPWYQREAPGKPVASNTARRREPPCTAVYCVTMERLVNLESGSRPFLAVPPGLMQKLFPNHSWRHQVLSSVQLKEETLLDKGSQLCRL